MKNSAKKILAVLLICLLSFTVFALCAAADSGTVVYVKDAGADTNDGKSADKAIKSLTKAYGMVANGGTIVICGDKAITTDFNTPQTQGTVTITSKYGGADYRTSASARLIFKGSLYLNGTTTIQDINIHVAVSNKAIGCNSNKVLLGDGIVCTNEESVADLSVVGGSFSTTATNSDESKGVDLTINSGKWRVIRGGNRSKSSKAIDGDIKLTINGGTYSSCIAGGSATKVNGNVNVTINGGTFNELISASYKNTEATGGVNGNVTLTINGGTFKKTIDLCMGTEPNVTGKGTLTVTGGDFSGVTAINGTNCAGGSTANIGNYAKKDDLSKLLNGFTAVNKEASSQPSTPSVPQDQPKDQPQTGDDMWILAGAMLLCVAAIGVTVVAGKAKKVR